jgi:hypothetical protein
MAAMASLMRGRNTATRNTGRASQPGSEMLHSCTARASRAVMPAIAGAHDPEPDIG